LPPMFRGDHSPSPAPRIQIPHPLPPNQTMERAPLTKVSQWAAPENWDMVKSQVQVCAILDSDSSNDDSCNDRRQSLSVGSHFQRFVRRMESAGPRIIFERLKEKWDLPGDRAMSDELSLEKHLWALTALQLPNMDRFARQHHAPLHQHPLPPLTPNRRRKILELDGSIGKFQFYTSPRPRLTLPQAKSINCLPSIQIRGSTTSPRIREAARFHYRARRSSTKLP
jgi:hypothetical protein